jgi:hypothetical protein
MLTDLDEALERLQASDFECGDGSVNQGTMAVVALEALGHPSLIPFFADVYVTRLRPLAAGSVIVGEARAKALGERARRSDWLATFETELADSDRESVLDRWLPLLLPGAFAAEGTGVMRVATALRALEGRDDAVRRRELALGLAHWASRYQVLPGEPGARPEAGCTPAAALDRLPRVPVARVDAASMGEAVRGLEADPDFSSVVASLDLDPERTAEMILGLVARVAALHVAHPDARAPYGRASRTAMALLELVEHAPPALHVDLAGRAGQIALALHRVYGPTSATGPEAGAVTDVERDALASDVDEIRYRAACSGDADAITSTEAYLRAHRRTGAPVLLRAAADAALSFGAAHGGRGG